MVPAAAGLLLAGAVLSGQPACRGALSSAVACSMRCLPLQAQRPDSVTPFHSFQVVSSQVYIQQLQNLRQDEQQLPEPPPPAKPTSPATTAFSGLLRLRSLGQAAAPGSPISRDPTGSLALSAAPGASLVQANPRRAALQALQAHFTACMEFIISQMAGCALELLLSMLGSGTKWCPRAQEHSCCMVQMHHGAVRLSARHTEHRKELVLPEMACSAEGVGIPACRYIPLQTIGERLLAQLEVQRWGDCRGTLLGLLAAYNYEVCCGAIPPSPQRDALDCLHRNRKEAG